MNEKFRKRIKAAGLDPDALKIVGLTDDEERGEVDLDSIPDEVVEQIVQHIKALHDQHGGEAFSGEEKFDLPPNTVARVRVGGDEASDFAKAATKLYDGWLEGLALNNIPPKVAMAAAARIIAVGFSGEESDENVRADLKTITDLIFKESRVFRQKVEENKDVVKEAIVNTGSKDESDLAEKMVAAKLAGKLDEFIAQARGKPTHGRVDLNTYAGPFGRA